MTFPRASSPMLMLIPSLARSPTAAQQVRPINHLFKERERERVREKKEKEEKKKVLTHGFLQSLGSCEVNKVKFGLQILKTGIRP